MTWLCMFEILCHWCWKTLFVKILAPNLEYQFRAYLDQDRVPGTHFFLSQNDDETRRRCRTVLNSVDFLTEISSLIRGPVTNLDQQQYLRKETK